MDNSVSLSHHKSMPIKPTPSQLPAQFCIKNLVDSLSNQLDRWYMPRRFQSGPTARQGVTAVLAMLYLTLMASLALGFYSASNTAIMVSHNEQKVERARLAAESGLDFARYYLGRTSIPQRTPVDQTFDLVGTRL